jgi:SAM-dependent methyltransferase
MADDPSKQWNQHGPDYRKLIVKDGRESSAYLRDVGLKPMVVDLVGDCSTASVLDVGTGGGWLFDALVVGRAHACDLAPPERMLDHVDFRIADAHALPWGDDEMDIIVSNLMLCYSRDLKGPLAEMARVSRSGGRLVVSLVHPYFYRTGDVGRDGSMTIVRDLSRPSSFPINIGNKVGPFEYYYRPYTDYLNALLKTGWCLDEARDWFIDPEPYEQLYPQDTVIRTSKVPLFTFFSCTLA